MVLYLALKIDTLWFSFTERSLFPFIRYVVIAVLIDTAVMPLHTRAWAIIGIILSTSLLTICTSANTTLGLIYNPDDRAGLVEDKNITVGLEDFARYPSGLYAIPLMAPLFRNTTVGSVRTAPDSYFRLHARGGECQCADVNSK